MYRIAQVETIQPARPRIYICVNGRIAWTAPTLLQRGMIVLKQRGVTTITHWICLVKLKRQSTMSFKFRDCARYDMPLGHSYGSNLRLEDKYITSKSRPRGDGVTPALGNDARLGYRKSLGKTKHQVV